MDQKHVKLSIIGFAVLLIGLVGVTYAFFNYTKTGTANTISTGGINFNTTQSSGVGTYINLTNVFPIDVSNGIPSNDSNVGELTINVAGDTDYTGGLEYLVSAVNVTNTVPISIDVSVEGNTTNNTILGTADEDYFDNRGSNANSSIYKVLAGETISTGDQLVVGYIKSGATGVDGNIVIKAYLDADKILISDTYNDGNTPTDNLGTPAELGEGKTVFTTTEWNALQSNGISFQVKIEAREGIWVEEPLSLGQIRSCRDCKFIYTTNVMYTTWNTYQGGQTPTELTTGLSDSYLDVVSSSGRDYFLGVKLNNSNQVTNAYACGIKNDVPFCIEGYYDNSKYTENQAVIQSTDLWGNACTIESEQTSCGSWDSSSISSRIKTNGEVTVGVVVAVDQCRVFNDGYFNCREH